MGQGPEADAARLRLHAMLRLAERDEERLRYALTLRKDMAMTSRSPRR
jgi:hypothetical protein